MEVAPRINPSADRNKHPILEILKDFLGRTDKFNAIEIASGTGQHCALFASEFSAASWQPTEFDFTLMSDITAHTKQHKNVLPPQMVNVSENIEDWKFQPQHIGKYDVGICINMVHISPIKCTLGLFRNMSKLLAPGGLLFTYGPYSMDGVISPQSNIDFNSSLKRRDPSWGLRDIMYLKGVGLSLGVKLELIIDMPSNNKMLVFRRLPPGYRDHGMAFDSDLTVI